MPELASEQGGKGSGGKPSGGAADSVFHGDTQGSGKFAMGGGNPFMSGTPGYNSGGGFYDFNPQAIAGASPLLNQAGKMAGGLGQAGQGGVQGAYGALGQAGDMYSGMGGLNPMYQAMVGGAGGLQGLSGNSQEAMDMYRSLPGIAGTQVTGENVKNDPAIKAANEQFMKTMAPMIKDSAGLAGLGKSGVMTNALASQQAQTLLPLIQGSLGREERGIDRLLGGTQAGAQGLFGGGQQETNRLLSQLGLYGQAGGAMQQGEQAGASGLAGIGGALAGLGGQEQNMLMNAIGGMSGLGGEFRNIEQQMLNAPYEEQMRMYSEALNSMYGPFGMIPGMFGSASTTQGGKK
ncbi:MAG TPA: hypothetical protein VMW79_07915 [Anaerolineae bacterium]|nr:hypothetical protein [Anaerolineae bacterium]